MGKVAYLVGVGEYSSPDFETLGSPPLDVAQLGQTLAKGEWEVDTCQQMGFVGITTDVAHFLQSLGPEDTALLYLSGHGIAEGTQSYFAATDSLLSSVTPTDARFVHIDFESGLVGDGPRQLFVIVDACRSQQFAKGPEAGISDWARIPVRQDRAGTDVIYLFSCASGQVSRSTEGGLSHFTSALIEFIETGNAQQLDAALPDIQSRLDSICDDSGHPRQQIAHSSYREGDQILLPFESEGPGSVVSATISRIRRLITKRADHPVTRAAVSAIFESVSSLYEDPSGDGSDQLSRSVWELNVPEQLLEAVTRIDAIQASSTSDQFHAANLALAVAINAAYFHDRARISSILRHPAGDVLTRNTAAAHKTVGPRMAVLGQSTDRGDERGSIEGLLDWSRLLTSSHSIGLESDHELLGTDRLAESLAPGDQDFASDLTAIVRGLAQLSTDEPRKPPLQDRRTAIGEAAVSIGTVEMLAAQVLCLALDPIAVCAESLSMVGTARNEMTPDELVGMLGRARWSVHDTNCDLRLICDAAHLDFDLRSYLNRMGGYLSSRWRRGSFGLKRLTFSTSGLTPASERYEVPHVSFSLSTEHVRRLLIGEQLYGRPEVALREMYQNSLDACRLRKFRLGDRSLGTLLPDYQGLITFRLHRLNGALTLDCTDDGIGMNGFDLRNAFAVAGRRKEDQADAVKEFTEIRSGDSADLSPTSQFGIGIFSYLMIADELEVFTRAAGAEGYVENTLALKSRAGASLVEVSSTDYQHIQSATGTTVRLRLNSKGIETAPTFVDALKFYVRVPEYRTVFVDDVGFARSHEWAPDSLHSRAGRAQGRAIGDSSVFLIDGDGEILVDGVTIGSYRPGLPVAIAGRSNIAKHHVLNLRGPDRPRISVDRSRIDSYVDAAFYIDDCQPSIETIDELLASSTLCLEWLCELARSNPQLSWSIIDLATSVLPIDREGSTTADPRALGLYPHDPEIISLQEKSPDGFSESARVPWRATHPSQGELRLLERAWREKCYKEAGVQLARETTPSGLRIEALDAFPAFDRLSSLALELGRVPMPDFIVGTGWVNDLEAVMGRASVISLLGGDRPVVRSDLSPHLSMLPSGAVDVFRLPLAIAFQPWKGHGAGTLSAAWEAGWSKLLLDPAAYEGSRGSIESTLLSWMALALGADLSDLQALLESCQIEVRGTLDGGLLAQLGDAAEAVRASLEQAPGQRQRVLGLLQTLFEASLSGLDLPSLHRLDTVIAAASESGTWPDALEVISTLVDPPRDSSAAASLEVYWPSSPWTGFGNTWTAGVGRQTVNLDPSELLLLSRDVDAVRPFQLPPSRLDALGRLALAENLRPGVIRTDLAQLLISRFDITLDQVLATTALIRQEPEHPYSASAARSVATLVLSSELDWESELQQFADWLYAHPGNIMIAEALTASCPTGVTPLGLIRAVEVTGLMFSRMASQLDGSGLSIADLRIGTIDGDMDRMAVALSIDLDGNSPALCGRVPDLHIVRLAARFGIPLEDAAAYVSELIASFSGYLSDGSTAASASLMGYVELSDLVELSATLDRAIEGSLDSSALDTDRWGTINARYSMEAPANWFD